MGFEPTLNTLLGLLATDPDQVQSSVYLERSILLHPPGDSAAARRRYFLDHPAAHYLLALRSADSRRAQGGQLRKLARMLGAPDWHQVDWEGENVRRKKTPVIPQATEPLEAWYLQRGPEAGPFFRRISRKGRILKHGISPQTVYNVVRRRAGSIPCSPHDARRTFASRLLEASKDLNAARRLLGHESTDTTELYDRRAEIADMNAMRLLGEASDDFSTQSTEDFE